MKESQLETGRPVSLRLTKTVAIFCLVLSAAASAWIHNFENLEAHLQMDALKLGYTPESWPNWPVRDR